MNIRAGIGPPCPDYEVKGAAFAHNTLDPDATAHKANQLATNRQSQAGTAESPSRRSVRLREGVEDQLLLIFGNPDTRVGNREVQCHLALACGVQLYLDTDLSPFGELDGIADEVHQDLPQPGGVGNQELRNRRLNPARQM